MVCSPFKFCLVLCSSKRVGREPHILIGYFPQRSAAESFEQLGNWRKSSESLDEVRPGGPVCVCA